jgi:hypothetical protein
MINHKELITYLAKLAYSADEFLCQIHPEVRSMFYDNTFAQNQTLMIEKLIETVYPDKSISDLVIWVVLEKVPGDETLKLDYYGKKFVLSTPESVAEYIEYYEQSSTTTKLKT